MQFRTLHISPKTNFTQRLIQFVRRQYVFIRIISQTLNNLYLDPVEVFRGVPYAAPPVGDLRLRPPRPPIPWKDIKFAKSFGAVCPQKYPDIRNETLALSLMPKGRYQQLTRLYTFLGNQSEDCLYLNLYIPASGKTFCYIYYMKYRSQNFL